MGILGMFQHTLLKQDIFFKFLTNIFRHVKSYLDTVLLDTACQRILQSDWLPERA